MTHPKIALVCDWLTEVGGAEQVILSLHHLYPKAPIYTSQYRPRRINWFKDAKVHTGWLNIFPSALRRFLGPFRQLYFSHLNLSDYDIVISITGAEAKSVKTVGKNHRATHFCYCHVPTQYYWAKYDDYLKNPGFGLLDPLARLALKVVVKPLRSADLRASRRPDYFITISTSAAEQIKKYYDREAQIIYPPVNTEFFHNPVENIKIKKKNCQPIQPYNYSISNIKSQVNDIITKYNKTSKSQIKITEQNLNHFCTSVENSGGYFINFSRQVNWKRLDLMVKACKKLNHPAIIIGEGPEHQTLSSLATNAPILFFPRLNKEDLKTLLKFAKAFIFPSHEPFGIAPVEALSAGCPVIAFGQGGARDFIIEGKNGLFFPKQSTNSLVSAIQEFEQKKSDLSSPLEIQSSADKFSTTSFNQNIQDFIDAKK